MNPSNNRQIEAALKNWDKATDKGIVKTYLSNIGIDKNLYMKYAGKQIRGSTLKYKVDGEYVSKRSILHKLGETCILRIPLDPVFQRKRGRLLQGKLQKNSCLYLGDPKSESLGIVKDFESALSLMSLLEFSEFLFAVCGTPGSFDKFTPGKKYERIVVFADDDFQTKEPINPGLTAAIDMVQRIIRTTSVEAEMCRPKRFEKIMRWNDLLKQEMLADSLEWGLDVDLYPEGPNIEKFLMQINGKQWGSIKVEEGVFWRFDSNGRMLKISNFMIHPDAVIFNPNGNESIDTTLIHVDGSTKPIMFDVEDLNEQTKFSLRCKSKGRWGYLWSGSGNNFHSLQLFLENMCRGKPHLKLVNYWGGLDGKTYFYSNAAISKDEIIEINDRRINIAGDTYLIERNKEMPYGKMIQTIYRKGVCDEAKVERAFRYFKESGEAALALGFGIGTLYLDRVVSEFGAFPFLGLFGYRGTGKTTLARMVMSLFGFKLMLPPFSYAGTTEAGISQGMEVLGNIPYWIDEYHGGKISRISEEFLKAVYGQASKGIGSLEGAKTRSVKSSLILSGQGMTFDSALNTRIVTIRLSRAELRTDVISWVFDNRDQLNLYGSKKIQQSLDIKNQQVFVKKVREEMEDMVTKGIDYRIALNYSVAISAIDLFTGLKAKKLKELVLCNLAEFQAEMETLDPINSFFNELLTFYLVNRRDEDLKTTIKEAIGVDKKKQRIFVRLHVLHSVLSGNSKNHIDSLIDLRANLVDEHAAVKGRHKIGRIFYKGVYAIPVKKACDEMKAAAIEIIGDEKLFETNEMRIV